MWVVLAGTVCDFRLSYGRVLNRRSKIIAVNRDKTQLLKNSDMFWKPTVAIQGKFTSGHRDAWPYCKITMYHWRRLVVLEECVKKILLSRYLY